MAPNARSRSEPRLSAVPVGRRRTGKGEPVGTLIADPPPGASVPPILPPQDGFLLLDRERFPEAFAGDLPRVAPVRSGMARWAGAWIVRSSPATTTVEIAASHSIYPSQPDAVADFIKRAAV
ncbi:hypothetical protein [Streptomyces sp. NPDC127119]|uniref:hypothetical protein n=1 Tax=Streptomyces sp. NPDC127119 TaxID=3345370 RepID=UPI0036389725